MTASSTLPRDAGQSAIPADLQRIFSAQRQAFRAAPRTSAGQRRERLQALSRALVRHQDALAQAASDDFGGRSADEFKMAELLFSLESLKYVRRHLAGWMKPEKRHVAALQQPGRARVEYQPLGVVGIIVPWNYPVFLAVGPLMYAIAAGNRAMIKMSGFTPRLAEVFRALIGEVFAEDEVAVITGRGEVSEAFPRLPFDQITFTGSSRVGAMVMTEAARNLTPVLLELGGKSPAIVHASFPLADAAERLSFGKCWNAGQTCIAPDHLYLPRGRGEEFVRLFTAQVAKLYPTLRDNADYTSIINDRQFARVQGYLAEARERGARVTEINPAGEDLSGTRKMPVTLVTGVTADMQLMRQELFAPVLPIIEYDHIGEVLDDIASRPHPLALYYFDYDDARAEHVIANTTSGGVTVNDVMAHAAADDLPFGGVGASGMGKYHGREGFLAMSNARAVMVKGRFYGLRHILPPFGKPAHRLIRRFMLS